MQDVTTEFEAHRTHLRAVAYRLLGSVHEADDAVQEAWLRLSRSHPHEIDNLGGWLTTVVSRICLDQLRSRTSRREAALDETTPLPGEAVRPEDEAVLADSVGVAMLVVLERLSPAERLAFVLHDTFGLPFDEIATITGRSPTAVRQLASRGRRRVREPDASPEADRATQRRVVDAFLTASRGGDFRGLLDLLDPDAVVRADGAAVERGAQPLTLGATAVAETFSGRAQGARLTLIDGYAGAVWRHQGETRVVFGFTVEDGRITEIELLADPDVLASLDLEPA
jgi:RNA polymerase sigma factor (sigma-70 family)